ncbi:hypothetical protein [Notoacmeibacter sp. MSK16QG-6]|uniref:hypothetical protein n=1 Tax=Notoacmeibacter sp. MSK16QG-6 TaxID=2957982 RepID=UPI00209FCA0E|nr:hypothetical protein [Notoacmeibacter sp. MSK16QG-6]MCP1198640.1 hypothetical protein [Notoacmeibacter sp. MSK16QG-6]
MRIGARSLLLLLAGLSTGLSGPAHASSEEAWEELTRDVDRACRAIADEQALNIDALRIDPFGDQDNAYALLQTSEDNADDEVRICRYDKASGTVTLSSPLMPSQNDAKANDAATSIEPGGETDLVFADGPFPMTSADRRELSALPARISGTIEALRADGWPADTLAEMVLQKLASGQTRLSAVRPGRYQCNVFWYGFLENSRQFLGTHRCRVERDRLGNLVILKLTGQGLNATLLEIESGGIAFAGRNAPSGSLAEPYDPERPTDRLNNNFGNVVGRVLTDGRRIYLVDINQRGMTEEDASYFQVIELVP